MPAYVLCEVTVTDPEAYEAYKALSGDAVAQHGGRFLVRGGTSEVLEGEPVPGRLVVIEFPDADAAKAWYDSEAYRAARAARAGAAIARFVVVDGVS